MGDDAKLVRAIRKLLERLVKSERLSNDDQEVVHDEVAAAVASLPREGILAALDQAVGSDKRRRRVSVMILTELTDVDEAIIRIGQTVRDPDPEWRNSVVQIVGKMRLVQFAEPLNGLILNEPDLTVRSMAIHAAGRLKSATNLPALLTVTRDHPSDLRRYILWALKEFATESCRPFLAATFHSPASEKDERVIAAWGLGKLGEQAAISYLTEMLDDPEIKSELGYYPGESLRAAQALCDIYTWPFEWHKGCVETTRERWRNRSDSIAPSTA